MKIFIDEEKQKKDFKIAEAMICLQNCLEFLLKEIGNTKVIKLIEEITNEN